MFFITSMTIIAIPGLFNVICWYLLANCGWKYEVLGQELKKIGEERERYDEIQSQFLKADELYSRDLKETMTSLNHINEYIVI